MVLAGFAFLFGEAFALEFHSADLPSTSIAIGCFALVAICVLLTTNRLMALVGAILIPTALMRGAFRSRQSAKLFLLQIAVGLLVLVVGVIAKFSWQGLRIRRTP